MPSPPPALVLSALPDPPLRVRRGLSYFMRLLVFCSLALSLAALASATVAYFEVRRSLERSLGNELLAMVRTLAPQIDGDLHGLIHRTDDGAIAGEDEFDDLRDILVRARNANDLLVAAKGGSSPLYTFRKTANFDATGELEFVVMTDKDKSGRFFVGNRYPSEPHNRDALAGTATASGIYADAEGTWISASAPIRNSAGDVVAILQADRHADYFDKKTGEAGLHILWAALAVIALGGVASWVLARTLTRPISTLVEATRHLAHEELDYRVPITRHDEIGTLCLSFNDMAGRLSESRQRLNELNLGLEHQVEARTRELRAAVAELTVRREEAEKLLLNILPAPVAQRLRKGARVIADRFDEATVLFADMAGFTEFSSGIPPENVLRFLNNVFSRFDDLAGEFGVEKIKTIGDAYMAVCGLPTPDHLHASRAADLALAMQQAIQDINHESGGSIEIRIGLNSGPVVAGVVGTRKFAYDLWGDTVNVASRMESTGINSAIQISEATWRLLNGDFICQERGEMTVKGRGVMRTYLLLGRA